MLEGKESIIWVEWLQDSEDFIKGGVYAAEAAIRNRDTGLYSRYQVRDERGDDQYLFTSDLGVLYRIADPL